MSELDDAVIKRNAKMNVHLRYLCSIPAENDYLLAQAEVEFIANKQLEQQSVVVVEKLDKPSRQKHQPKRSNGRLRGGF